MTKLHPQFITDQKGKKISVVLPMKDFQALMDQIEELEDIALYDEGKREDNGERVLFDDYLKKRRKKNA